MNLDDLVGSLEEAIGLGESLGLGENLDYARETLRIAREREGFPGEVFALALIGGTGVGKSTLLNSIAGETVSEASVIRPTTAKPKAWIGEDNVEEVRPLLDWLDVDQVVTQGSDRLKGVALLDLPDFDSIVTEHRLTVDRLMPRLDSLLWVVDPEKYDDERLYEYLREIAPRADAFHIVLNKIDRLSSEELVELSRDLIRRLTEAGIDGAALHRVSAAAGEGVEDLVAVLEKRAHEKRVVFGKIRADVVSAVDRIAELAGLHKGRDGTVLTDETLEKYRQAAVGEAMSVVDLPGIGRQVASAYLERSKVTAGSLLGRIGAMARLAFGVRRRRSDPARYVRAWRSRGDVSGAVNVLRNAYLEATSGMPVQSRASVLERMDPDSASEGVTKALDNALSESAAEIAVRTPLLWRLLMVLQLVATGGALVAGMWYVTLWLAPGELAVGTVDVPEVGPVPTPLLLLVSSIVLSLAVGGVARLHASWIGRREARKVMNRVSAQVMSSLDQHGFGTISRLQADRAALAKLRDQVRVV